MDYPHGKLEHNFFRVILSVIGKECKKVTIKVKSAVVIKLKSAKSY